MTTLELFSGRHLRVVPVEDTSEKGRPFLLAHAIRTALLVCILAVSFVYQVRLGNFLNTDMWLPIYSALGLSFLLNAVYLFFFDRLKQQIIWNGVLFFTDVIVVSLLIYYTGTSQSLFMFLYLVNLILAALIFPKEGAWILTGWTSICFSTLMILSPEVGGQNLYFSLAINNLAFVALTFLSGRLAEQLSSAGIRLEEAKSDIQALQDFNELIVNNVTSGLLVVSRTGFVQFNNPAAEKILGHKLHQEKISDALPNLDWAEWVPLVQSGARKEVQVNIDGIDRDIEVVATPFRDAEEKSKGWLLHLEDRSEIKVLEMQLRQREKLAAVGQLAAGIAHEIRNPLAGISGSIQMMMGDRPVDAAEQKKLMNIVSREIDRLNGLITEFLEYVRPEQRITTYVDLNAIVREVMEMMRFNQKVRTDVEIKMVLNAKSEILGHKDKLKQALINFVVNSYQAMDKTPKPVLEISTTDETDKVVFIIRDNGCGIKKENLNRIFEPFHTTKPSGSGLGLAITHKILESHQARVFVESEVGEGTRFLIEFPSHRDTYIEDPRTRKQA
jgi:two-component system, NtrC family, sensor histidine kinase PilS